MASRLTTQQFKKLSEFIESGYGIRMPSEKHVMLQARLTKRMRQLDIEDFDAYLSLVFNGPHSEDEVRIMMNLVSTNKTNFFREVSHFSSLREKVLPELVRMGPFSSQNPLILWSAGCSSGEEPYTLAMVMEEFKRSRGLSIPRFDYAILATDLSTDVLEKGKKGIYDVAALVDIPREFHKRYLLKSRDPQKQQFRLVPELRNHIFFHRLNLMDSDFLIENPVHIIFCRNVMIYFNKQNQKKLIAKFWRCLVPGGFLFLGHSETLFDGINNFTVVAPTIYRKKSE